MLRDTASILHALDQAGTHAEALCQQYGSPIYIYDADCVRHQYARLSAALVSAGLGERCHIHYAIKANDRLGILRLLREAGAGGDLVSVGEMQRALKAGFAAENLVYSGVGKTADDLRIAISAGVGQINAESLAEVILLEQIAHDLQCKVNVAFRLNPDTRAGGHDRISTGAAEHKFGFSRHDVQSAIVLAQQSEWLDPVGIALHIGSQIIDITAYQQAFATLNRFLDETNFEPQVLDLGGGFAIDYTHGEDVFDLEAYAACVQQAFAHRPARLMIEPGRFLVGPSGVLILRTLLEKQAGSVRWVITEMAMNDLMRPALYQAKHRLSVLSETKAIYTPAMLGGPVCESTDTLGEYALPPCPPGTILALHDVGAYGSVMANNYNARHLPAELLLDNHQLRLLRPAITTSDWLQYEESI